MKHERGANHDKQGLERPDSTSVSWVVLVIKVSTFPIIENPSRSGYVRAVNVNLKSLMEVAYDVPDLRMFGGPPWLTSARFSIGAEADPSINEQLAALPSDQAKQFKRKMMAALLAERFKLG